MPECCGAGHYFALCCLELYFQYGLDHDFSVEPCCPTCRCRRTPLFAPCIKFETTCTILDCKLSFPCDADQPLEIGLCGWTCYTKKEVINTTGKVLIVIKTIKVHDMKSMELLGEWIISNKKKIYRSVQFQFVSHPSFLLLFPTDGEDKHSLTSTL